MLIINKDNYIIYLGKNAQENWDLLSKNKKCLWFHLENFPSGHCVIECSREIFNFDKSIIIFCCQLVKDNSKYKNLKNIKVMYTLLKNIKKGNKVGEVNVKGKYEVIIL